jgi:holo-[acyl-carrier protein] synthase
MAVFCGTDIISVARIKNSITELGETFIKRIYTDEEINYCESKRMCKFQSYAARFAAKEAMYKALSPESADNVSWHDLEIVKKKNGKPVAKLSGRLKDEADKKEISDEDIDISLSHDDSYAIATVVIKK